MSITGTEWRAPDLDCATLRLTEDRRDPDGTVTGHFEVQPVRVTLGTLASALFDVPSDYTEKSLSQMHDAIVNHFGNPSRPMIESVRKRLEQEDAAYLANHRAAGVK